jgi:hypothetical protein
VDIVRLKLLAQFLHAVDGFRHVRV